MVAAHCTNRDCRGRGLLDDAHPKDAALIERLKDGCIECGAPVVLQDWWDDDVDDDDDFYQEVIQL